MQPLCPDVVARRGPYRNKDEKTLRKIREMQGRDPNEATTRHEWKRHELNRNREGSAPPVRDNNQRNEGGPLEHIIGDMRRKFGGSGEYSVYLMKLKPSAWEIKPQFHKHPNYPRLTHNPEDYVYVGYTSKTVRDRFYDHVEGTVASRAARVAKKGHLWSSEYTSCCLPMTKRFGIEGIAEIETAKKLESWIGWSLYLENYFVWGPDYHQKKSFLGREPYFNPTKIAHLRNQQPSTVRPREHKPDSKIHAHGKKAEVQHDDLPRQSRSTPSKRRLPFIPQLPKSWFGGKAKTEDEDEFDGEFSEEWA